MSEGWWPRGVTPRPRSGAAAESARLRQCRSGQGATLCPRSGSMAERSHPVPKARGSSREEPPHIQEEVAVRAQEGLEEPSHVGGQEGRW